MYPSILSFVTINKLKLFFEYGIPRPQNVLRYCNFLTHFIISIAVMNVPLDAGLQKRDTLSNLNVVLAGTGNRTRATCVTNSGTNRLSIHYAFKRHVDWSILFSLFRQGPLTSEVHGLGQLHITSREGKFPEIKA
jgi:hypothetical protein